MPDKIKDKIHRTACIFFICFLQLVSSDETEQGGDYDRDQNEHLFSEVEEQHVISDTSEPHSAPETLGLHSISETLEHPILATHEQHSTPETQEQQAEKDEILPGNENKYDSENVGNYQDIKKYHNIFENFMDPNSDEMLERQHLTSETQEQLLGKSEILSESNDKNDAENKGVQEEIKQQHKKLRNFMDQNFLEELKRLALANGSNDDPEIRTAIDKINMSISADATKKGAAADTNDNEKKELEEGESEKSQNGSTIRNHLYNTGKKNDDNGGYVIDSNNNKRNTLDTLFDAPYVMIDSLFQTINDIFAPRDSKIGVKKVVNTVGLVSKSIVSSFFEGFLYVGKYLRAV